MKKSSLNTKGFGLLGILAVVFVVAIAGFSGWLVWSKDHDSKKSANTNTSTSNDTKGQNTNTTTDPYAGWKTYNSPAYGLNFKYPSEWSFVEGAVGPSDSATKQEYAISLKRSVQVKYNETATIEILNENLTAASGWYDDYFAQSPLNTVSKSTSQLKGKQSVQYSVTNSGQTVKLYLLGVGNKTYLVSSINESTNVQADADYWVKFDKMFDSLQVN